MRTVSVWRLLSIEHAMQFTSIQRRIPLSLTCGPYLASRTLKTLGFGSLASKTLTTLGFGSLA